MNKPFLVVVTLLIVLLVGVPVARAQDSPILTLDEAIAMALRENRALQQADYQARAAQWGAAQSFSAWLPKVGFDTTYTRIDSETYDRAYQQYQYLKQYNPSTKRTAYRDSYSSSIVVTQPIFNGSGELASIRSGLVTRDNERFNFEDARLQVIAQVKQAYYAALKARALKVVVKESLDLARESLRLATARFDVGSATQSDVLRWEAEVARAEGALAEADNAHAQAEMELSRILGGPVERRWQLPELDTDLPDAELQRAADAMEAGSGSPLSISGHPAVRATTGNLDLARIETGHSIGNLFPNINLTYQYSWYTNDTIQLDGDTSWVLGVSVQIPLFQGIAAATGIGRSVHQERATRMAVEDFDRTFLQQVYAARLSLNAARLRVISARKAVSHSQANLEIVNQRAELGMATNLEQLDAQIAFQQARSDLIGAVSDFHGALAQWDYLTARTKE